MSEYRQPSVSPAAQPGVNHRQDGDLLVILLAGEQVDQRGRAQAASAPVKNEAGLGGVQPGGHQADGYRVPASGLAEHVEAGETGGRGRIAAAGRRRDGRSLFPAAGPPRGRPIPPTMVTSRGASNGGPISML